MSGAGIGLVFVALIAPVVATITSLISALLNQVSGSGSGSGSNHRAFFSAEQRAANYSRGGSDDCSFGFAVTRPVIAIVAASLSAGTQASESSEHESDDKKRG
jgi:hypothetical protein